MYNKDIKQTATSTIKLFHSALLVDTIQQNISMLPKVSFIFRHIFMYPCFLHGGTRLNICGWLPYQQQPQRNKISKMAEELAFHLDAGGKVRPGCCYLQELLHAQLTDRGHTNTHAQRLFTLI